MTRAVESIEVALDARRCRCFDAVQSNPVSVWHADGGSRTPPLSGPPVAEQRDAPSRNVIRTRSSADAMTVTAW